MMSVQSTEGDYTLPSIGLGTMGFGGFYSRDNNGIHECVNLVEAAFDVGVTVVDTAEIYGDGAAEEILGQVQKKVRDELFIMTKFSPEHSRPEDIKAALERSLSRLNREHVDVYQPHWPSPDVPFDDIMYAIDRLKQEGKIRFLGLSNHGSGLMDAADNFPVAPVRFVQGELNPIERSVYNDLIDPIARTDGAFIAYSPLRVGKIFEGREGEELTKIAANNNCSPAQLVLAWVIHHERVIAIPKSISIARVEENAAAMNLNIPQVELQKISKLFQLDVEELLPRDINPVAPEDINNSRVYRTLEQAKRNEVALSPGPLEIAEEIRANGGRLNKPIKVRAVERDGSYVLIEGKLRYWAWIILYGDNKPIPTIVLR